MENSYPLAIVADKLQLRISHDADRNEQLAALSKFIGDLIPTDFQKLLNLLYRVDVSEKRVKAALVENTKSKSAGLLIVRLLIEREIEKMKLRAKYRNT